MKLAALIASAGETDGFPEGAIRSLENFPDDHDIPAGYTPLTETDVLRLREAYADPVSMWVEAKKLDALRERTLLRLKEDLRAFIERRYSPAQQRTLAFQLQSAIAKGDTAKTARIILVSDWIAAAVSAYHAVRPQVQQASSIEQLAALSIDFAALVAADPAVTLEEVVQS